MSIISIWSHYSLGSQISKYLLDSAINIIFPEIIFYFSDTSEFNDT